MRTAKEALQALHEAAFDIVLKNHDPAAGVNACRFLRKAASSIPVVGKAPATTAGTHVWSFHPEHVSVQRNGAEPRNAVSGSDVWHCLTQ